MRSLYEGNSYFFGQVVRAALIQGRLLLIIFVNIIKCGHYMRVSLISLDKLYVRLLFEDGYNLTYGYYSSKYGICIKNRKKAH